MTTPEQIRIGQTIAVATGTATAVLDATESGIEAWVDMRPMIASAMRSLIHQLTTMHEVEIPALVAMIEYDTRRTP